MICNQPEQRQVAAAPMRFPRDWYCRGHPIGANGLNRPLSETYDAAGGGSFVMKSAPTRYNILARTLHWTVVGLILVQVPLAYIMIDQPISPAKLGNYALHKSLGLTVFMLTVLRLAWQLATDKPALPDTMPGFERIAARAVEGGLYLLTLAMPLTGWLNSSAANIPVSFFSLFTLPDLVAPDEGLQEAFELAHRLESYALFALLAVHVLAALRHHFLLRDDVLLTMLPFRRRRGRSS